MIVLGIETSCDETAAAIVNSDRKILSESIYSQIKTHEKYLGVVPELAARSHIDHCDKVIKDVINKANLSISEKFLELYPNSSNPTVSINYIK